MSRIGFLKTWWRIYPHRAGAPTVLAAVLPAGPGTQRSSCGMPSDLCRCSSATMQSRSSHSGRVLGSYFISATKSLRSEGIRS